MTDLEVGFIAGCLFAGMAVSVVWAIVLKRMKDELTDLRSTTESKAEPKEES